MSADSSVVMKAVELPTRKRSGDHQRGARRLVALLAGAGIFAALPSSAVAGDWEPWGYRTNSI